MAEKCEQCQCKPYENKCCCPVKDGIFVAQPECQRLPDGRVVNNPCYCVEGDIKCSFWTYKVVTNCDRGTRGVSSIAIPICEAIPADNIRVEEKVDGCGEFEEVDTFELKRTDPNYGEASEGFRFLKIETNDRYDKGVAVDYRIRIHGNYPVGTQPISVKAGPNILTFDCDDDCYQVPACPAIPRLFVVKDCKEIIEDNMATLKYNITVSNTGDTDFDDVDILDRITYDASNIVFGAISVDPQLEIDIVAPGVIEISGSLGEINRGESKHISIEVPIINVETPNRYLINNTAVASFEGIEATDSCILNLDAVQLAVDKCCIQGATANSKIFRIIVNNVGHSPQTDIGIKDIMIIPQEVTVRFTNFDVCTATFADDGSPVPLNTDISGRAINITCSNINIPQGGSAVKEISFNVVGTTAISSPIEIINTIQDINFLNEGEQILLGVDNLPATASVAIIGNVDCEDPC
ncbi:hypothetical protein [Halonatronum saccharophilum]|uniref:hypothetical protein n=1 Tax=Halonatronum saccharophilum TaxID=150060 RepID=UPI000489C0EC|nr:hypothetical protein [Halonatronum saccharophilum]